MPVATWSDLILLAVKPNMVASVLKEAGPALERKALMSIAAGVSSQKLKEFGGTYFLRVLRIMPNYPAMLGVGTMVLCSDTDFTQEERAAADDETYHLLSSGFDTGGITVRYYGYITGETMY